MTGHYIEGLILMWVSQKAEPEMKDLSETMLLGSVIPGSRGEERGE